MSGDKTGRVGKIGDYCSDRASSNDTPLVHSIVEAPASLFFLKAIPEAKGLVSSAGNNSLTIWAHRQVEDSVSMASERNNLLHVGIFPDDDLILAVSVGRHNFVAVLRPCQIADLATGVKASDEVGRCTRLEVHVAGT